jgi:hypothetical protein
MRRIACWFHGQFPFGGSGHDWRIVNGTPVKIAALNHLHLLAGYDAVCLRCGKWWLDSDDRQWDADKLRIARPRLDKIASDAARLAVRITTLRKRR